MRKTILTLAVVLVAGAQAGNRAMAQEAAPERPHAVTQPVVPAPGQPSPAADDAAMRSSYVVGPDDQLSVTVPELEEISDKPMLVDTNGLIYLPLVGAIRAQGLTIEQLRQEIITRLRKYIKDPTVTLNVLEFRSQPVSVLGAVGTPGVLQLRGNKNLIEVLSMAGGMRQDAGNLIYISRRLENGPLPLPGATDDPTGHFSTAHVDIKEIMDAKNPQENIEIKPNDVISVPKAELVYVVGEVHVAGGIVLSERKSISILEALSMSGGLSNNAASGSARILRLVPGKNSRREIPVNIGKIMKGKEEDMGLLANDILVIPSSALKKAVNTVVPTAVSSVTAAGAYAGIR